MLSAAWLRFISVIAFTSAIASAVATAAAYVFGWSTLPPIQIGNNVFVFSLIAYGYIFAAVYIVSNIFDALTPQVSEAYNTLGKIGSWTAFVIFTATGLLVFGQMAANGENIRTVLATSGSAQLLAVLWGFSLFDILVLQRMKNRSLAHHDVLHGDLVHNGEIVRNAPASVRGVPLIAHADYAIVIDARGQELDLSFTDGTPERLRLHPATPTAGG